MKVHHLSCATLCPPLAKAWLNRSAHHRQAIAEYGGLWSEFDQLGQLTASIGAERGAQRGAEGAAGARREGEGGAEPRAGQAGGGARCEAGSPQGRIQG